MTEYPLESNGRVDETYRIISHHKADDTGPVVVAIGGMHGNENYGIAALRKIDELFVGGNGISNGEWIGVAANVKALYERVRYIDEDMNRIWFPSIIDKIRRTDESNLKSNERVEIKMLLKVLDPYLQDKNRELIFVDLHSFSAPGGLFVITPRSERNIVKLSGLSVPLIFGIDDALQGTALRYFHNQGHISIAFEGGQHHDSNTLLNMIAYLLLITERFNLIDTSYIEKFETYRKQIKKVAGKLPDRVELAYQHIIEPDDKFVMRPGFENFQKIEKGDWLADDTNGKIIAPCSGFMLMPLYQKQGNDGFFIVREL